MLADVNGIKLAFSDSGSGSPVMLLVHGYPLNRSMWDPQLGSLRAAGFRVIAPDLRGFGASEPGPPGPFTMEQHADDLAGLLDALGISDPVVVCGLSMGGYVSFAVWRRHRERVLALVLMDTRANADTGANRINREELARRAEEQNSSAPALEAMLPRYFAPSLRPGSLPEHLARSMILSNSARAVADGARGLALRQDSLDLLPSIDVPTLVIVGEDDVLTPPSDAEQIASGIGGARLVRITGAGHMANLENADEVNQVLIDFVHSQTTSTV